MHYKQIVALLLPALANAAPSIVVSACYTSYGSTSKHPVPTGHSSTTKTFGVTLKTTSTPVLTVTPPVSTSTQTNTVTTTSTTTLPQVTGTFTTTSVAYTTSTIVSQVATTTTATATTISTSTMTISSAGFTPLASELAAMGDTYAKRSIDQLRNRAPGMIGQRSGNRNGVHPSQSAPKSYPNKVQCNTLTEVFAIATSTVKASTTQTTILASLTTTVTVTSTLTSVSTQLQTPATATVTAITTSTLSATTTQTNTIVTTTTTTSVVTAATPVNAMCAPNNMISSINGSPIDDGYQSTNGFSYVGTATDASDCCNQCYLAGNHCGGYLYELDATNPNACFLFAPDDLTTCSGSTNAGELAYSSDAYSFTAGNSFCGQFGTVTDGN